MAKYNIRELIRNGDKPMKKKKSMKRLPAKYAVAYIMVRTAPDNKSLYHQVGIAYSRETTEHAAIGDVITALTPHQGEVRGFWLSDIVATPLPQ